MTLGISKKLIERLIKKIKVGTTRSPYLNAIVGNRLTRIDVVEIDRISYGFLNNFIKSLLKDGSFELKFRLGDDESYELFKKSSLEKNNDMEEKEIQKEFESIVHLASNRINTIITQQNDILQETGIPSFGFGFPMVVRNEISSYSNGKQKLIVAPLIVRTLELSAVRGEKNTFVISRTEEVGRSSNGILSSHVSILNELEIPEIGEEDSLGEEQLAEYINRFFHTFSQSYDDYGDLLNIKSLPSKQKLEKDSSDKFDLYLSGTFGIYKQQKETIKVSMQEILNHYDEIFGGEDNVELKYEHCFGAVEQDPSQTQILNALSGDNPNIIIQGPPGTGKSHTIKAILTNALQQGHSSLVICEKKTALEVIAKGLDELGLKDSYVIIEDAKKDRKKIISKVRSFVDNPGNLIQVPFDYKTTLSKQNRLIDEINKAHKSLSKIVYDDIDWKQLVGRVLKMENDIKNGKVKDKLCSFFSDKILGDKVELYKKYYELVDKASSIYHSEDYEKYKTLSRFFENYYGVQEGFKNYEKINSDTLNFISELDIKLKNLGEINSLYSGELDKLKANVEDSVKNFIANINLGISTFNSCFNTEGLKFSNRLTSQNSKLMSQVKLINNLKYDEQSLNLDDVIDVLLKSVSKIGTIISEIKNLVDSFNGYTSEIYIKLKEVKNLIDEGVSIYGNSFGTKTKNEFKDSIIGWFSASVREKNQLRDEIFGLFDDLYSELLKYFSINIKNSEICIRDIYDVTEHFYEILEKGSINILIDRIRKLDKIKVYSKNADLIKQDISLLYQKLINMLPWYGIKLPIEVHNLAQMENKINNIKVLIDDYKINFSKFSSIYQWHDLEKSLDKGDKKLMSILFDIPNDEWVKYFQYSFFDSILRHEYGGEIIGNMDEKIKILSNVMNSFRKQQIDYIKNIVWREKDKALDKFHAKHGQEPKVLYALRASKGQKAKSLRYMVRYDTDFFKKFFPIILTNPATCAQLFKTERNVFDLVIFDEASQLRVEDTVQCLIRGKKKIICGDDKQMPPSDYFGTNLTIDGDETAEDEMPLIDISDMANEESLLSFANDQGFLSKMLKIHYRSQHPYLIDFSNVAYYKGELKPFPSKINYKPIEYFYCKGNYNKGVNEEEADKVIEILCNILKQYDEEHLPPIGIATFNIKQRFLLLDKISELRSNDDEIGNKLNKYDANNFFVKNLDSIQGDERDIIIVSTTFGINNETGKFAQQFGPINTTNGHRYLNVMITRAKKKLIVVSGIPSEYYGRYEEELNKCGGVLGRAGLYSWLAYVKSVSDGNEELRKHILNVIAESGEDFGESEFSTTVEGYTESPFEEEVVEEMRRILPNTKIELQKWVAGFRLDIAVESPTGKKLAIECDGASYHSSDEAYAWDMFRQKEIENSCGYVFHRIWSTNWWTDREGEVKNLYEFLKKNGCN